jgi:pimeloyl-ACP methyl ester carboxylesterase
MPNREASKKAVRRERRHFVRRWHLVLLLALSLSPSLMAQDDRTVRVDDRQMRVRVAGLREGVRGRPVVVFESGAGTGLTAWSSVLPDVSEFATVVAYDRAGIGGSEADEHAPTPAHLARRLNALLAGIGVHPPYVLVGHSWGGLLIRMFAAMYPEKVTGLVYVDPTDPRSFEQNLAYLEASGYSAEGARDFLARKREQMAQFVRSQRGPYMAEMEVIQALELSYFAEFRALPPLPSVPVALLLANRLDTEMWSGRPCVPIVCRDAWMAQRIKALQLLAPPGPNSTVTLSEESGHAIQRDQPSLVVSAIRRVLALRSGR